MQEIVMKLGGWKSLELVQRYSHLAPDHKQKAVDKLAEVLKFCLNNDKSSKIKSNNNKN